MTDIMARLGRTTSTRRWPRLQETGLDALDLGKA